MPKNDQGTTEAAERAPEPARALPTLYKATVHLRWLNTVSREYNDVFGGDVVTFDDGDFGGGRALTSLEDVLARGLFVPFDPARARDVDAMSRDEMLELLVRAGKGDGLEHQTRAEVLRPLVAAHLAAEDAAAAEALRAEQVAAAIARLEGKES